MLNLVIKLLKSISLWTIIGTIAALISLYYVIIDHQHAEIELSIGNYKIKNNSSTIIYYICSPIAGNYKYVFHMPVDVGNNNSGSIKNFKITLQSAMPSVPKTDQFLLRLLGYDFTSENNIECMIPNINELMPFSNVKLNLWMNTFFSEDKPLNYFGCYDSFDFTINMNYENIEEPFNASVFVVFIFTDPNNKMTIRKSFFSGENELILDDKIKIEALKEYSKYKFDNQIYINTHLKEIESSTPSRALYQYVDIEKL